MSTSITTPVNAPPLRPTTPAPTAQQVDNAEKTRDAFNQFVGATVFGQMLGSMRKTVGEPAYFHGGRAEQVFQSQLDQAIADELTTRGASPFAQAMFEQQFPDHAEVLRRAAEGDIAAADPATDQAAEADAAPAGPAPGFTPPAETDPAAQAALAYDLLDQLANLPRR